MANHSGAWHDLGEKAKDKETAARDAWGRGDTRTAKELDREASDLRDKQKNA